MRGVFRCLNMGLPLALALGVLGCSPSMTGDRSQVAPPPGLFDQGGTGRASSSLLLDGRVGTDETGQSADPDAKPPTEAELYTGSGRFVGTGRGDARVDERDGTFTLNFADADIRRVVDVVLGETLGLSYIVDDRVSGSITARSARPLPQDKVIPALEDILAMNGAALVFSGGIHRVVPMDSAFNAVPLLVGQQARQQGFGIHIIPVRYASADAMQTMFEPFLAPGRGLQVDGARNILLFRGPGGEARDLVSMIELFDIDWMEGMSFALLPLTYANVGDVLVEMDALFGQEQDNPTPMTGVIRFMPVERMNALLAISENPQYLERARIWAERLDRGGGTEGQRQLYVYHLKNARASEVGAVLGELFDVRSVGEGQGFGGESALGRQSGSFSGLTGSRGGLGSNESGSALAGLDRATASPTSRTPSQSTSTGTGSRRSASQGRSDNDPFASGGGPRIIADERNDAMLVLATAQEYRMIEQTMKRLDIVPLQVLIEATIAEVTLNDALNFGIRWFFDAGTQSDTHDFTFTDTANGVVVSTFPGFSYLFDGGDARLALSALSEITEVTIVSSPSLMVLDNKTARLQVGDQVPVPVQQSVSTQNPDAPIVNSIQFEDTGVILEVTPHVNASGLVVLDVLQEVSNVVATTSSGIDAPTIQQRAINSTVAVQTGETIALGGLIRDRATTTNNGVPVLMNIPLLGNLFKSKGLSSERTELLVLLTPQVVRDQAEARAVTQELRRRLKGLERLRENFAPTAELEGQAEVEESAESTDPVSPAESAEPTEPDMRKDDTN